MIIVNLVAWNLKGLSLLYLDFPIYSRLIITIIIFIIILILNAFRFNFIIFHLLFDLFIPFIIFTFTSDPEYPSLSNLKNERDFLSSPFTIIATITIITIISDFIYFVRVIGIVIPFFVLGLLIFWGKSLNGIP